MNSKKGKKVHLEIILFFIVSIYCLLAPNRETCMDDTWISSIVGLSGSVKLFSVKLFLLAPLWWGILCYILLRLANPYLKEHGVKLQINNRIYKALIKIFTIAFLIGIFISRVFSTQRGAATCLPSAHACSIRRRVSTSSSLET